MSCVGQHFTINPIITRRRIMAKRSTWLLISLCLVALLAGNVYAAPIVTFSVSGSSGDWSLDFSVTNTGGTNDIYFFGVKLPAVDITSIPTGWTTYGDFNTVGFGGPDILFNNNWILYSFPDVNHVQPGRHSAVLWRTIFQPRRRPWYPGLLLPMAGLTLAATTLIPQVILGLATRWAPHPCPPASCCSARDLSVWQH